MRVYEKNMFSYFCSVVDEWHSKTKTSIGIDTAVSPHPNLLPMGEGDKNFLTLSMIFPFSLLGRRAGDEGLNERRLFLICAPWSTSGIQRQKESIG
jgi:hypothetical protein